MRTLEWKQYVIAFIITAAMFGTAFYVSILLNNARLAQIQGTEDKISTDILSIETQFDLIDEASCDTLEADRVLPSEINSLATRLDTAEQTLGTDNEQVLELKKQYSLLEIKDYIIAKQVATRCGKAPTSVLYFYSNKDDCKACTDAGYALDAMRETYPSLRVYSFDYNLDLGALKTLTAVEKVAPHFPAFVIDGKNYYGFTTLDALEAEFPKGSLSTTTATSTASNTNTSPAGN